MKKLFFLSIIFLFCFASVQTYGQATRKQYIEVYSVSVPLGLSIPAGSLVYRADSNFWIVTKLALAKSDSMTMCIRRGWRSYYDFVGKDASIIKWTMSADSNSATLPSGSMRVTNTNLWIKIGTTWKGWHKTLVN